MKFLLRRLRTDFETKGPEGVIFVFYWQKPPIKVKVLVGTRAGQSFSKLFEFLFQSFNERTGVSFSLCEKQLLKCDWKALK